MTKPNKTTEVDLNELYQQRKAKYAAPSIIKRKVMSENHSGWNWQSIYQQFGAIALAASTLLLIGLISLQQLPNQQKPLMVYRTIEVHDLQPEEIGTAEQIRNQYAARYNQYLAQRQTFAFHHQKSAILHQANSGWEMTTCDQELVKVSNDLLMALIGINKIESKIENGDSVEIMFDESGIILGIKQAKQALHC